MPYRYNADHIAQARGKYNPQKDNMGMLELHVDGLVPGGQEILMLSIISATIPGYKVERGQISHLNGTIFFPQKPSPLGEMATRFYDYHDSGTREILESLFRKVYDQRTGLMNIPANVKSQGTFLLLREDGQDGREYYLDGVWPTSQPGKEFDFTKPGGATTIDLNWSVDFVIGKQ